MPQQVADSIHGVAVVIYILSDDSMPQQVADSIHGVAVMSCTPLT